MKRLLSVCALSAACALNLSCQKKADLSSDMGKASYALGQQIGKNFKNQSVEVDLNTFTVSMEEAMKGQEPKMKPEEIQAALQKLNEIVMKKQGEKAAEGKKAASDFMAQNKSKEGVKTSETGLQYVIENPGTGKAPKATSTVTVHYRGTLTNGQQFDSSYDRKAPADIPLNSVIPAWKEAIPLLKVGGKMKLFVPPELGYGERNVPGIPANSVLVFDIELIAIK